MRKSKNVHDMGGASLCQETGKKGHQVERHHMRWVKYHKSCVVKGVVVVSSPTFLEPLCPRRRALFLLFGSCSCLGPSKPSSFDAPELNPRVSNADSSVPSLNPTGILRGSWRGRMSTSKTVHGSTKYHARGSESRSGIIKLAAMRVEPVIQEPVKTLY